MMKNIRVYEQWNEEEEENIDLLRNYLGNRKFRPDFDKAFGDRQMDADIVSEPLSETEFIVECWPKTFDGVVPNKISYYIDEIATILSGLFGVSGVTWRFEGGKGVSRIIFDLNEPINRDMIKFKNMIL
jgi:hypothetical protein